MENPFLSREILPDWSKMAPEYIGGAVKEAIEKSRNNLESIKSVPKGGLDYENCVMAFDESTMPIDIVYTRIGHLASVADSPELRAAYNASIGEITDFYSSIRLDDALYARFAEYSESPEGASLKGERARMLSEIMLDFELGGAKLPEREKKRIREIDSLLAIKTQKFSENVLDDTKAFSLDIEDPADLTGLPPTAVAVAAATATAEGKKGWTFTLDQPSYVPFMSYAVFCL